MERSRHNLRVTIYGLFLLSGATALAYEVIWTRMLVRVFGATAFAVSTVLAAYMAGLALGSYLFGRLADRKGDPILTYGLLELGIGLFALVFPHLLASLNRVYRGLYLGLEGKLYTLSILRFALSFIVLLVPTTLMGGTLPVLSRFVAGSLSNLTARVGALYSLNTLGAVAGASATGFLLLPSLGMKTTTYAAVAGNLAIFLVSLAVVARRGAVSRTEAASLNSSLSQDVATSRARPEHQSGSGVQAASSERVVLVAFLLTGVAGLAAEVIWTRALALVVGTTIYAFTTMLTAFLLGLALGSAVFARIAQRVARPTAVLGWLIVAIGFAVFLSTAGFGRLPVLYMTIYQSLNAAWGNFLLLPLLLSLLVMIVPTFLMGGTFPLVARIYATDLSRVGGRIGTAYAFNTLGAILGSFLGAFVLLKLLGVRGGMSVVSITYVSVGALVLVLSCEKAARRRWRATSMLFVGGAVVLVMLVVPGWDPGMMTSGVYTYAPFYGTADRLRERVKSAEMLFYDDSPGATVSVERDRNVVCLVIDGKTDASTGDDMITQQLLSHLPFLLHPHPDTALVIGLGSGVSLGSAAAQGAGYIDCVELLPSVREAAGFFRAYNHDALSNPRVHLILGDGRNHLLFTDKTYDVIASEPTNPWISGVGDLFTVEFFRAAARHLKPGGIMSAWLQTYQMGDGEFRSALKTFASVFPYAMLWIVNEVDVIMIGSLGPIRINGTFVEKMKEPSVRADLARVMINEPSDVLSMLWLGDEDLRSYAGEGSRMNTDDNMLLEFGTGRRLVESTLARRMSDFVRRMAPRYFDEIDSLTNEKTQRQVMARRTAMMGVISETEGDLGKATDLYDAAYSDAPTDPFVVSKYAKEHLDLGLSLLSGGQYDAAIGHFQKARGDGKLSDSWMAYHGLGLCYYYKRDYNEARENLGRGLELNPYNAAGYLYLGMTSMALGDTLQAIADHEKAFELRPWDAGSASALARAYATAGVNLERALELARTASKRSHDAESYDTLGLVYLKKGDLDRAESSLREALRITPQHVGSAYHLALVKHARGQDEQAETLLGQVLRADPGGPFAASAQALLHELHEK